jgi:hypothetical protein
MAAASDYTFSKYAGRGAMIVLSATAMRFPVHTPMPSDGGFTP